MRVFLTGATGWVGSAIVPELVAAGHTVVGLARDPGKAAALAAAGAEVLIGTLDETDRLAAAARDADAVIHTAFSHDFSRVAEASAQDAAAIAAMGAALAGTAKPFLVTSGVALLAPGGPRRKATPRRSTPAGRAAPTSRRRTWPTAACARRRCGSPRASMATAIRGSCAS